MKLQFLWIGSTRNPEYARLEQGYLEKLKRFTRVDQSAVRELKKTDPRSLTAQFDREAQSLKKRLSSETFLICLDQKGKQVSSEGFAKKLQNLMNQGTTEVTFVVGGYLGIPEEILNRSRMKLALGKMTLPHELARVVLLEQVFRAMSIIKGFPYHR